MMRSRATGWERAKAVKRPASGLETVFKVRVKILKGRAIVF